MSAGRERRVVFTPLVEDVISRIQQHHASWNGGARMTRGQALDWLVRDFEWCEPDKPAYGRWSPVLAGIIKDALKAQPTADKHGDG